MHAFDSMHAFDCAHASCITGAVYIEYDCNASFGGEAVFANNTAEFGGTTVTQVTTNITFPARGYSGGIVLPGLSDSVVRRRTRAAVAWHLPYSC